MIICFGKMDVLANFLEGVVSRSQEGVADATGGGAACCTQVGGRADSDGRPELHSGCYAFLFSSLIQMSIPPTYTET